jgi:hypothetical protein
MAGKAWQTIRRDRQSLVDMEHSHPHPPDQPGNFQQRNLFHLLIYMRLPDQNRDR